MNVGILGGSITGCAMAAELSRVGCRVAVLERGGEEPKDRGAGIGLPPSLLSTLVEHDLLDRDAPHLDVHAFRHVVKDEREERFGRQLWEQPGSMSLLNWGALYENLRRRVPRGAYRTGCRVIALGDDPDRGPWVRLDDGHTEGFNLLVCADGHRSLGRQVLFPDSPPTYAHYVLWRGAVEEKLLADVGPLESAVCWPSYVGGHGPFFLVPGADGSVARGRRLVNWGLYLGVYELSRAELLTGKNPSAYEGPLSPEREARLKAWVPEVLPELYAEIVTRSAATHVQMIHESTIPAYHEGRICLAGDAGALARPHTGTGVLKGMTDAIALAEALRGHNRVQDGIAHYSREQTAFGNQLVKLASQVGSALATELPTGAPPDAKPRTFASMVTVPSEVFASG